MPADVAEFFPGIDTIAKVFNQLLETGYIIYRPQYNISSIQAPHYIVR